MINSMASFQTASTLFQPAMLGFDQANSQTLPLHLASWGAEQLQAKFMCMASRHGPVIWIFFKRCDGVTHKLQ